MGVGLERSVESLGKDIQNTINKIEEATRESVEAVYEMVEKSIDSLNLLFAIFRFCFHRICLYLCRN